MPLTRFLTPLVVATTALAGCASRYETGQALVASGTVVAVVASELATNGSQCALRAPCAGLYGSTSRHSDAAAAGVAAGVALAAAGSVLEESDPPTDAKRRRPAPSVSPPKSANQ